VLWHRLVECTTMVMVTKSRLTVVSLIFDLFHKLMIRQSRELVEKKGMNNVDEFVFKYCIR